jgi:hypothetical protein
MNPNDLLAQQQAILNQAMQNQQHVQYAMFAFWLAGLLTTAFVLYMFYARLRDIGQELMKFRIAYEFAHTPETRSRPRHER